MRYLVYITLIVCSFLVSEGCKTSQVKSADIDILKSSHKQWQVDRLEGLKQPKGYLSLVGLYWLQEGKNTFGSAPQNDLIFPEPFNPSLGIIEKSGDQVTLKPSSSKVFTIESKYATETELLSDVSGSPTIMNKDSYFWYLIKRGEQYAIRLKDTLNADRINLTSVPSYSFDDQWIKKATFYPSQDDETIPITNVIGITYDRKLMGSVEFLHGEKRYQLTATDGGNNKLFIVFADQTSGKDTYGGGRFLYVDIPEVGQEMLLDFNRAENPVCAFSDFATCPLPRPENHLPFAVEVGEKKVR